MWRRPYSEYSVARLDFIELERYRHAGIDEQGLWGALVPVLLLFRRNISRPMNRAGTD